MTRGWALGLWSLLSIVAACDGAPQLDAALSLDARVAEDTPRYVDGLLERPDGLEPIDAPPSLDAPFTPDATPQDAPRYVDGLLVPDDGSIVVADAPSSGGCGYSIEAGTFVCGGTDPTPGDCSGGCCGICDPFGTDQVCCDPSTGTITIYRYSAGDCPLDVTMACP